MASSISPEPSMVTIFTNGPPDGSDNVQHALKTATALGMKIESRRIQRLKSLPEGLNVVLDDGEELYMGFLVHFQESVPLASDLIASLGLEMLDSPIGRMMKRNEPFGDTSISGVFACGDVCSIMKHVTQAMAQGENPAVFGTQQLTDSQARLRLSVSCRNCIARKPALHWPRTSAGTRFRRLRRSTEQTTMNRDFKSRHRRDFGSPFLMACLSSYLLRCQCKAGLNRNEIHALTAAQLQEERYHL